jgi:hypothetical protein
VTTIVTTPPDPLSANEPPTRALAALTTFDLPTFFEEGLATPSAGRTAAPVAPPERAPAPPVPGPGIGGAGASGGSAPPLLLFAILLATLALAAPRLGRWLRPTPDARRPQHVLAFEAPG